MYEHCCSHFIHKQNDFSTEIKFHYFLIILNKEVMLDIYLRTHMSCVTSRSTTRNPTLRMTTTSKRFFSGSPTLCLKASLLWSKTLDYDCSLTRDLTFQKLLPAQNVDVQGESCGYLRTVVQGGRHGGGEEHQGPQASRAWDNPQSSGSLKKCVPLIT